MTGLDAAMERTEKSALVTGATGFIGSHLVRRLVSEGWKVRALARDPRKLGGDLARTVEVIRGDLTDSGALRAAVRGARIVFHCAANVRTWDTLPAYRAANVAGAANVVSAIASECGRRARLVHLSSVDVYGFPTAPANEGAELRPCGFGYSDSKREGELRVLALCRELGVDVVVLRPANVMGPGSPFISRIGAAVASGLMLKVDGGQANAGFLHVTNLVETMVWAADSETPPGECFNVRDPCDVSWARFLDDFRNGIDGRGWILDLRFDTASRVARALASLQRLVTPGREPILHPLIVCMFGRTCGHPIDKLRSAGGLRGVVGYDEAMKQSIDWFRGARAVR